MKKKTVKSCLLNLMLFEKFVGVFNKAFAISANTTGEHHLISLFSLRNITVPLYFAF